MCRVRVHLGTPANLIRLDTQYPKGKREGVPIADQTKFRGKLIVDFFFDFAFLGLLSPKSSRGGIEEPLLILVPEQEQSQRHAQRPRHVRASHQTRRPA